MTALKYSLFILYRASGSGARFESCNRCQLVWRPLLLTTINRNLKRIKSEGDSISDERDDVVQNKDSINQICALRPPTTAHTLRNTASAKIYIVPMHAQPHQIYLQPLKCRVSRSQRITSLSLSLSLLHFYRAARENLLFAHRNANKMKF